MRESKSSLEKQLIGSRTNVQNAVGKQTQVEQQCDALRQEVTRLKAVCVEEKKKREIAMLHVSQSKEQHGADVQVNVQLKGQLESMKHAQSANIQIKGQLESRLDLSKKNATDQITSMKMKLDFDKAANKIITMVITRLYIKV